MSKQFVDAVELSDLDSVVALVHELDGFGLIVTDPDLIRATLTRMGKPILEALRDGN
ncbi:hypothetical protein LCGC14_2433380 [marine sediment metagenome]|uniref:Uncharacterized protein n=1 Tax=marine sediment metagenome TaxID=412755 RepID=A0A0F9BLB3_9ZZZZ